MSYRVEISPNTRATCSATHCKKEGIKVIKGEIRQAVMVMFQEKQSWKYRHWGCVTPSVLHNWREACGMDMDLVDGYEDLPEDAQKKIKRALEAEHVDDKEWNGDPECNRWNGKKSQGMFVKTPKKGSKDEEDAEEQSSPTKKAPSKKRSRAATKDEDISEDEVSEKAPAKGKRSTKKTAKVEDDDEKPPPAKKSRKTKQSAPEEDEPAPAKKSRSKKVKVEPVDEEMEEEASSPVPAKKSKSKSATAKSSKSDLKDDRPASKPTKKAKGRSKKNIAVEDED